MRNLKIAGAGIGIVSLVFYYIYSHNFISDPIYPMQLPLPMTQSADLKANATFQETSDEYGVNTMNTSIKWSPYMDVLDENIVMKDEPLEDMREIAKVANSVYNIIHPKKVYRIGDKVDLFIQLYDGFGKRRSVGGDRMEVRIFENSLDAMANGYIVDHMNGTYTATVTCLWAGSPSIEITLTFPRQVIRMFYEQLRTNCRTIFVFYKNNERQPCQPTRELLNLSKPICNMADRNGGMSWFCQAPEVRGVTCKDVKIFNNNSFTIKTSRKTDAGLENISPAKFLPTTVVVKGRMNPDRQENKPQCGSYNRTKLWFLPPPVGYFMNKKWNLIHCTAPTQETIYECLRNKHLILYGDSTVSQWRSALSRRFKLSTYRQKMKISGEPLVKQDSFSHNTRLNLTVDTILHSLPGNRFRNFSNSIAQHMLKYLGKKNMVFVIHIYTHILTHHHSLWRDRLKQIRHSIELFLQRDTGARFLIKGGSGVFNPRLYRYARYLYRRVLLEEFEGIFPYVIYLDNDDINIALANTKVHPDQPQVHGMVDQMLAYLCN